MNRHLVAFLSLFSLVLVLSVYYVMIPSVNSNQNSNNDIPVNGVIVDAESAYFESLDIERDALFNSYYQEQNQILVSSTFTNEEKEQALIKIEELKQKESMLSSFENSIKGIGYQNVFVEYVNDDIKVVTTSIDQENKLIEAAQIIYTLQDMMDEDHNVFVEFYNN